MENKWDFDEKNDRLVAYLPSFTYDDEEKLKKDLQEKTRGKRIVYTTSEHKAALESQGFEQEAVTSGFFDGEMAVIMTQYDKKERQQSTTLEDNKSILQVVQNDRKTLTPSTVYPIGIVQEEELSSLAKLYKKVFPKYPTNVFEVEALKEAIRTDYMFVVAKNGDEVIAAASAMRTGYNSAEVTDCAVNPEYRGKQLLHILIEDLEKSCKKEGIYNLFSITRARSTGMNMTVKRLGYDYEGTLVNNCIITSGFEDMNVWSKSL
ncbi:putative beta-lysine N-acetyltransferase [Alteribacter aurantiacus]|uniref:putative beta-lysine N-acetyltransferase n=1 Tax=Alteribacter aurantiacus TaxID=254410 RepID=UPI00041BFAFB|nr:putative beta-lysine N-acetyltransferase [Alteribacter aurantiacus]